MSSSLAISGLASGFDWQSLITQLVELERSPEKQLLTQQNKLEAQNNAISSLNTELSVLRGKTAILKDATFFSTRAATSSNEDMGTATAANGAALGTTRFNITQLAAAAVLKGASGIGAPLNSSDDVSALTLSNAAFSTTVTEGVFTVNGKQVSITTSDTLQGVFDKISTATGGTVTASYSSADDKITLSGAGEIVLGSATDTSNFLQAARLRNTGIAGNVVSSAKIGAVKLSSPLEAANLVTPVVDGGGGEFKINGVSITYSASTDAMSDIIRRINESSAGVVAAYDSLNNRLTLTNKETGDVGIAVEDVTGNFAAAAGLTTATLTHGKDLLYTINGGGELSSHSNTITESSSGLAGLSVKVIGEGEFDVTVDSDTTKIKTAITDFVAAYNKVQALIGTQTASSTDAKGKVTAGLLANDSDVTSLTSRLRGLVTATVAGMSGVVKRLESLGFNSNGSDDSLSSADLEGLDTALSGNLSDLTTLFTQSGSGIAEQIDSFLDTVIGTDGSLITHQSNLTKQSKTIDTQIDEIEKHVLSYQERLTAQFAAMETAQSRINQQMSYLQKVFGS